MNNYIQRLFLLVAALTAVCTAAPVNSVNDRLQLLARDTAPSGGITLPQGATLDFSLAAEGTQNYTCNATSQTWVLVGALAHLSNSTLYYEPSKLVGFHYFVWNNGALSPEWDLSLSQPDNQGNNFVIGTKIGQVASPDGPTNVPWLLVQGNEGENGLARFIVRVLTEGGVPQSPSCNPSTDSYLTVPYKSLYMFWK
ncbi:hypothetical protein Unana1_01532 [Umbelopsis nana]